jgi:pilus assembly protein CpaE
VFAPKGGAGASTVAVNVAIGLASRSTVTSAQQWSYPAAIIDADLQFGDQALMLGLEPTRSLASLTSPAPGMVVHPNLAGGIGSGGQSVGTTHKGFLDLVIPHRRSGVGLLGSPVDPALADTVPAGLVTAAMASIGSQTPWLVVDLPSHIGDLTMEVIEHSGHLLVVTCADPPSVKDARVVADTLDRLGIAPDAWTLVCNSVNARGGLSVGQIQQHVGVVAGAVIPDDPAVALSLLRGNPVVLDNPRCDASQALQALVDNLIGVERPVSPSTMASKPLRHLRHLGELGHRARAVAMASVRGDR